MKRTICVFLGMLSLVMVLNGCGGQKTEEQVVASEAVAPEAQVLYAEAQQLMQNGGQVEAKEKLNTLMMEHPDFDQVEQVQDMLYTINMELVTTNAPSPYTVDHEVVSGDTLGKLAKKYGTTVELIKLRNNLKSDIIRIGQRLSIWTASFNIYVDKSQNILLLKQGEEILKTYSVSTGSNNNTPVGEYSITTKLVDPVWFKSGAIIAPDSPANVLGTRWLGFDLAGYGIHGTIEPEKIGQQATAGCVRMINKQVEELYNIVPTGTKVKIVD